MKHTGNINIKCNAEEIKKYRMGEKVKVVAEGKIVSLDKDFETMVSNSKKDNKNEYNVRMELDNIKQKDMGMNSKNNMNMKNKDNKEWKSYIKEK